MSDLLLLIDGSSYFFRAFHALPPLKSSKGEPCGAIYGVANMIKRALKDYNPKFVAVVFDAKGPTFRNTIYPLYKAHRPPVPDELSLQFEPLIELIVALGLKVITMPEVEADDVIATLAMQALDLSMEVIISTSDKDLAQLVRPGITLVNTMTQQVLDVDGVKAKFGVAPQQIIDYLALMGDTSDNVPGINKCGAKTAAKWLAEYGDISNLLAHADTIKGKIGEYLRAGIEQLMISKSLVTLKTDVNLPIKAHDLIIRESNNAKIQEFALRYEFKTWLKQSTSPALDFAVITTEAELRSLLPAILAASYLVIDTETTSLDANCAKLVGISLAWPDSKAYYIPIGHQDPMPQLSQDLAEPSSRGSSTRPSNLSIDQQGLPTLTQAGLPTLTQDGLPTLAQQGLPALTQDGLPTLAQQGLPTLTQAGLPTLAQQGLPTLTQAGLPTLAQQRLPALYARDPSMSQLPQDLVLDILRAVLENPQVLKIGQNLKYDYTVLKHHGITLNKIYADTMLESYLLDSSLRKHDMDSLALRHLNYKTMSFTDVAGSGAKQVTFDKVPIAKAAFYAAEDADITLKLHETLYPLLPEKLKELLHNLEVPLIKILATMEMAGVLVDTALLQQHSATLKIKIADLEAEAYSICGKTFNLSSPKQLQVVLYEEQGLPILAKTPTGQPSTAEDVLAELGLNYRIASVITEYRSLSKLVSTYLDALPKQINARSGRIHTSYNQAVTTTGRLSSSNPNLQNIPIRTEDGRLIRRAFIAPPGFVLLAADYSQIELKVMAHLSRDKGLMHAFSNNLDVHQATAAEIFGVNLAEVSLEQRRRAKAINFGLIYGMSAFGLAKEIGASRNEAQSYIDTYFARYPAILEYMNKTRDFALEHGFVETIFGRRLYLPDVRANNAMLRASAFRTAINAPMQGSAADIIKFAMLDLDHWLNSENFPITMIMQVHDELVFEVPQDLADYASSKIKHIMENTTTLAVPLVVSVGVGENWDEAH
jgi:DNA polymerase I